MDEYVVIGNLIVYSKLFEIYVQFVVQIGQLLYYDCLLVLLYGFKVVVQVFQWCGGCGVNVIVFFKLEVYVLVDQLIECVCLVGVVNMFKFEGGCIFGDNMDGVGLVIDIMVNVGQVLVGCCVLLLGVGGVLCGVLLLLL